MKEFWNKTTTLIRLARRHQLRATLDKVVANRLDTQYTVAPTSKPS
jgi:L-rhamnose isomerase